MATVQTYVTQLRPVATQIASNYGSNLADKSLRVGLMTLLTMFCALLKLLVDKGLITDQDLSLAMANVGNGSWPDEPVTPTGP